jgi:hypothetical protein
LVAPGSGGGEPGSTATTVMHGFNTAVRPARRPPVFNQLRV